MIVKISRWIVKKYDSDMVIVSKKEYSMKENVLGFLISYLKECDNTIAPDLFYKNSLLASIITRVNLLKRENF